MTIAMSWIMVGRARELEQAVCANAANGKSVEPSEGLVEQVSLLSRSGPRKSLKQQKLTEFA